MTRLSDWLDEEQIQGMFWNVDTPNRRVPGVFKLADRRAPEVTLWDSLNPIPDATSYAIPVRQTIDVVAGHTSMGRVTLLEASAGHYGPNFGLGTWAGHLGARAAYLGEAYGPGEIEHDSFRVMLDGLDLLVPFRFAEEHFEWPRFSHTVDVSQEVVGSADGITVTVRMAATTLGRKLGESDRSRQLLAIDIMVDGRSPKRMGLDNWTDMFIDPVRQLVAFALGKLTTLRSVSRVDQVAHPRKEGETYPHHIPLVGTGMGLNVEATKRLLGVPIVSFRDPQIIERWWELWSDERKRHVVERISNAADPDASPKNRFSELAEATEGWHKAHHHPRRMDYKERVEALIAVTEEWKLSHHVLATPASIVKARNAVAHGDVLPKAGAFSPQIQTLRMLLRYHIAVALGIEPDDAKYRALSAEHWG